MRIAFVSPYSWSIPGGVNRHIAELSQALQARGDETVIFAPWDPDDRRSRIVHGQAVKGAQRPHNLVSLGRTVGLPMNGSKSNLSIFPSTAVRLSAGLQREFDVVHIHEPVAPVPSWYATSLGRLPAVGTFHTYSTNAVSNNIANLIGARRIFNKLHVRIAVSEAAKWTGQRFFGGNYTVVPNGVDLAQAPTGPKTESDQLRILFVGRTDERKGLPVLLRAFSALRQYVPARLTVVGAGKKEVEPLLLHTDCDPGDVDLKGQLSNQQLWRELHAADLLCAPSLGGESFGMVLIEAQAAGTSVVCSDIAGYRDVVNGGEDALLVSPGQPADLALAVESLWFSPEHRQQLSVAGRENAARYGWPRVAEDVSNCYQRAIECHAEAQAAVGLKKIAQRSGLSPVDGRPRLRPKRLPSLDPVPKASGIVTWARRIVTAAAALGAGALGYLAVHKIGIDKVVAAFVKSSPSWVLLAALLMALAPLLRSISWHAILKAALPKRIVRRRDVLRGTLIGILMSATLPARLGEPSRALVVARRIGRARENLPVVAGSMVSQILLNLLALLILGTVMVASVPIFSHGHRPLLLISTLPAVLFLAVMIAPLLVRKDPAADSHRFKRLLGAARQAMVKVRSGLTVFRRPKFAAVATASQLSAWVLQWFSCYLLFYALGIESQVGLGAAAAVLFAVNVTAVVPLTPSNIGIFQAAVIAVLKGAYGVDWGTALAYGVILQAVELGTALAMGIPALMGEGLSWRDIRRRALATAPVELPGRHRREQIAAETRII